MNAVNGWKGNGQDFAGCSLEPETFTVDTDAVPTGGYDPFAELRRDLADAINRYTDGNVSAAARQIGVPPSTLHSILNERERNDPRPHTRDLILKWIEHWRMSSPVTASGETAHPRREASPMPSPRQKALALIESLDDSQISELIPELRRLVCAIWQRDEDDREAPGDDPHP